MKTTELKNYRVTFEEHGQDFSQWTIVDGVVVDSYVFQTSAWGGTKILNEPKVGSKLKIRTKYSKEDSELRYPVKQIEEIVTERIPDKNTLVVTRKSDNTELMRLSLKDIDVWLPKPSSTTKNSSKASSPKSASKTRSSTSSGSSTSARSTKRKRSRKVG